jgi:trehalose 6-phosphate synthase
MNLVAKEYVAAQDGDDAALVLSKFAGAYRQLGDDAIGVNPRDTPETAAAIEHALEMDDAERRVRMRRLRKQVAGETVEGWIESVIDAAATVAGRRGQVQ